ncbi:TRAP transporter large permease [Chelativorans sp. AA-79]|uniref:TRAP transporter large permease n=1 Tax=Chelativorans sp. AA-79 TaxID=3028735 RepID=UPI0023F8E2BA|nr:TRAP transporter large permease [Chelativorans sp. AA-79]WEX11832.1 TRAP transporter large permease [Chelativorans sp. AA-79]
MLLAVRVPIAAALGLVSLVGIWMIRGSTAAFGALGTLTYDFAANWSLSAVPMFLLLGAITYRTGITGVLYSAARVWMNWMPGGLAVATNFASAGFAAMCGSSVATAAAMGRIAIPEMLDRKYDKALAAGTVAAAGTLGALIPPSILFILYGWFSEQPIGALLIAGVLPGLLTAGAYAAMIIIRCKLNPALAPPAPPVTDRNEKWRELGRAWPIPILIVAIIGGIYGGVVTPTEAGAFGAFVAIVIATVQGRMSWRVLSDSIIDAVRTTGAIFLIAISAILLTRFLALSGVPRYLSGLVTTHDINGIELVLAIAVIYILLGMFLDAIGLMLLTLPIFLPIFISAGFDLIWMGVLVVKFLEIGVLTPPVGINAFVVKQVAGDAIPLMTVFRGIGWFLACEVVVVGLLIAFPEISLLLPSLM